MLESLDDEKEREKKAKHQEREKLLTMIVVSTDVFLMTLLLIIS